MDNKLSARCRMQRAAHAIRGTAGEFRRVAILNFCAVAISVLSGGVT
jgi:hypothetical protein